MQKVHMYIFFSCIVLAAISFGIYTIFFSEVKLEKVVPVATVFMTKLGFNPSDFSIKRGQAVEFLNGESKECPISDVSCNFWPASDLHPSHEIYPEFDPREPIAPGESWVFTFDKVGNWGFHDHFKTRNRGVVHVVE